MSRPTDDMSSAMYPHPTDEHFIPEEMEALKKRLKDRREAENRKAGRKYSFVQGK